MEKIEKKSVAVPVFSIERGGIVDGIKIKTGDSSFVGDVSLHSPIFRWEPDPERKTVGRIIWEEAGDFNPPKFLKIDFSNADEADLGEDGGVLVFVRAEARIVQEKDAHLLYEGRKKVFLLKKGGMIRIMEYESGEDRDYVLQEKDGRLKIILGTEWRIIEKFQKHNCVFLKMIDDSWVGKEIEIYELRFKGEVGLQKPWNEIERRLFWLKFDSLELSYRWSGTIIRRKGSCLVVQEKGFSQPHSILGANTLVSLKRDDIVRVFRNFARQDFPEIPDSAPEFLEIRKGEKSKQEVLDFLRKNRGALKMLFLFPGLAEDFQIVRENFPKFREPSDEERTKINKITKDCEVLKARDWLEKAGGLVSLASKDRGDWVSNWVNLSPFLKIRKMEPSCLMEVQLGGFLTLKFFYSVKRFEFDSHRIEIILRDHNMVALVESLKEFLIAIKYFNESLPTI